MISADELRRLVCYHPTTGEFTWRISRPGCRQYDRVGRMGAYGYRYISVGGYERLSHRMAWYYMTGEWPKEEIDHINGIKDDNRWCNLRKATSSQNGCNRKGPDRDSTTGIRGVVYRPDKPTKPWQGRVGMKGMKRRYASFKTAEEAEAWAIKTRAEMHGEFADEVPVRKGKE